jgi:hypothetical protein
MLALIPQPVSLPAGFIVWVISQAAAFLKSRLMRCKMDADELEAKKAEMVSEMGCLDLGVIE